MAPGGRPRVDCSWFRPSLFASFIIILLVMTSSAYFAYPCRWLAGRGEWAFALVTGPLFLLTLWSLVRLNTSDPGILHRGSLEQDPEVGHTAWMHSHAYQMPWCHQCNFHRPPRTLHCKTCNICVEEFDHHSRWVNNCIGHRNFRLFLLLLVSLCLYLVALIVTCVIFVVRTTDMSLSLDKILTIIVAVLATGALLPVIFELLVQAVAVSTARRLYEVQDNNPFDQGCMRNWHVTLCAPLGPKYMSEVVLLQQDSGSKWETMAALQPPTFSPEHHRPHLPGPNSQPVSFDTSYEGAPGSAVI
ncbi:palmitoyltransferase ZDHHC19-like [Sciurus carolinensis]|uniref:palmitoyltransferase ZDHHC19-like n=1 Tax=Sciurus carolinensis TaxID=30640 RepID=UPI001FB399C9|nr:palmitoyltransferase ZDHHC19-like [Sciurus carolinensis]